MVTPIKLLLTRSWFFNCMMLIQRAQVLIACMGQWMEPLTIYIACVIARNCLYQVYALNSIQEPWGGKTLMLRKFVCQNSLLLWPAVMMSRESKLYFSWMVCVLCTRVFTLCCMLCFTIPDDTILNSYFPKMGGSWYHFQPYFLSSSAKAWLVLALEPGPIPV